MVFFWNAKGEKTDLIVSPENKSAQPVWGALPESGFVDSADREPKDYDVVSTVICGNLTTAKTIWITILF
jgi:hypothetical protein